MIDVRFSHFNNGACPMCRHYNDCPILHAMNKAVNEVTTPRYDTIMELVIYRCPEFEERSETDTIPE
jgi:hypothetical protein